MVGWSLDSGILVVTSIESEEWTGAKNWLIGLMAIWIRLAVIRSTIGGLVDTQSVTQNTKMTTATKRDTPITIQQCSLICAQILNR